MSRINYDLRQIKGFVFDVDGVLSPSTIPIGEDGNPTRQANIKDGYALQLACKLGYHIAIITGAKSEAIKRRYEALGIPHVYIGAEVKIGIFNDWLKEVGLTADEVIYVGDDIPDYEIMQVVGLPCCPHDAAVEIQAISKYISPITGGYGCVRDIVEQVLRAQDNWMKDRKAFGW